MAAPHSTFSQALSTSIYNFVTRGKFADNVYSKQALLEAAKAFNGIKRQPGGESLVAQLEYAENATAGWLGPYGTFNTNPQDILTSAQFGWKSVAGTVILTDLEQVQNDGPQKMADLISLKIRNLQKSLRKEMTRAFWNDGTNPLEPVGLRAIIGTTGTLGGISRTTQTWWRANVESTAEVLSVPRMVTMYNNCSAGGEDYPQILVTTQTLYEKYEALAQAFQEIQHPGHGNVADLAFEHLRFKGKPVIWDAQCPTGEMDFINFNYLKIMPREGWEFRQLPVDRPGNQPLEIHAVSWFGGFVPTNPRMLGALRNKTA